MLVQIFLKSETKIASFILKVCEVVEQTLVPMLGPTPSAGASVS